MLMVNEVHFDFLSVVEGFSNSLIKLKTLIDKSHVSRLLLNSKFSSFMVRYVMQIILQFKLC